MAKSDAPHHITALDGHRPKAADGRFGHQPTRPVTQTRGHQPVVPQGPSSQGGAQPANGGTGAQVPSNPPNQGTSGKK